MFVNPPSPPQPPRLNHNGYCYIGLTLYNPQLYLSAPRTILRVFISVTKGRGAADTRSRRRESKRGASGDAIPDEASVQWIYWILSKWDIYVFRGWTLNRVCCQLCADKIKITSRQASPILSPWYDSVRLRKNRGSVQNPDTHPRKSELQLQYISNVKLAAGNCRVHGAGLPRNCIGNSWRFISHINMI